MSEPRHIADDPFLFDTSSATQVTALQLHGYWAYWPDSLVGVLGANPKALSFEILTKRSLCMETF